MKKKSICIVLTIIFCFLLAGCKSESSESFTTLEDFKHAKIAIMTGASFDQQAKEYLPEAERVYLNSYSDLILNLKQGKVDGMLMDKGFLAPLKWVDKEFGGIEMDMPDAQYGIALSKTLEGSRLEKNLNEFIQEKTESGWIDELEEKWMGDSEPTDIIDTSHLTGDNGVIKVAATADTKPYTYLKGEQCTGFDIDFLIKFAEEYGYQLEIDIMDFSALLPSLSANRYEIAVSGITITEERKESALFSDPYYSSDIVMGVYGQNNGGSGNFIQSISDSFEKTFIRENRWKLITEGLGVTVLISVCAIIIGSLVGFGLYLLSRAEIKAVQKLTKKVAKVYTRIIDGTPVVVILMILFYVIFGQFRDLSGVLVAIVGFSLTFGAFVYSHMTVSVGNVNKGQTEAAYSLGYTKRQTFYRIIFPQAMTIFMPSYCGQAVELVKATAVVGYIAVNDLTKMGDIIRSNTYEAFFPLIATAVIYFLVTWILALLLKRVKLRFEPKKRSDEAVLKSIVK